LISNLGKLTTRITLSATVVVFFFWSILSVLTYLENSFQREAATRLLMQQSALDAMEYFDTWIARVQSGLTSATSVRNLLLKGDGATADLRQRAEKEIDGILRPEPIHGIGAFVLNSQSRVVLSTLPSSDLPARIADASKNAPAPSKFNFPLLYGFRHGDRNLVAVSMDVEAEGKRLGTMVVVYRATVLGELIAQLAIPRDRERHFGRRKWDSNCPLGCWPKWRVGLD
jgi:hypothetical protein